MTPTGHIVVVGNEAQTRRIVRAVRSLRSCAGFTSLEGLAAGIGAVMRPCGIVALDTLVDGSGLMAIERLRAVAGHAPALLMVDAPATATLAGAYASRVRILPNTANDELLQRFAVDCIIADFEPEESVRAAMIETAQRYGLTAVEVEVVHGAIHGRRFEWFARELGLSLPAYKARVASILRKTMADDMNTLTREILWLALQRDNVRLVG